MIHASKRFLSRSRYFLGFLGSAFVASIAYIDPGNFATNLAAGSKYGYMLLWVVVLANGMAMLIQYLSAKLGIVSDGNLAQLCRERYGKRARIFLWLQAEIVVMSVDLAEFVGAAIALNLLFGVPLLASAAITAVVSFALLELQQRNYRRFELTIIGFLIIIFAGLLYNIIDILPLQPGVVSGLIPHLAGAESVLLAAGIIGATVMPHVVYLHSDLVRTKNNIGLPLEAQSTSQYYQSAHSKRKLLFYQRWDVVVAMGVAGILNIIVLCFASSLFYGQNVTEIPQAYHMINTEVSHIAAIAFALVLLASGLASSTVGTYAGQIVMDGFLQRKFSLYLRRFVTMIPAIVVIVAGVNLTAALVISQVILSFGIPFALIPLVRFTSDKQLMGEFVNGKFVTVLASLFAGIIIILNVYLIGSYLT